MEENNLKEPIKLVDAKGLQSALFETASCPSLRWIRELQKQKAIPYYKIGRLVRFDPEAVRKALAKRGRRKS